jgi:transposase
MHDTSRLSVPARKRRYLSAEEKRQIVEEAMVPGASVSAVARARGVNANLLFHWRKLYRAGLFSNPEAASVRLLPVQVEEENDKKGRGVGSTADEVGWIEVRLAKAQVRIAGQVNAGVVRAVLECLLG